MFDGTRRGVVAVALATFLSVLLAGCFPTADPTTPVSTPTPSERKLDGSIAAEIYASYLHTSDLVLSEGGIAPERMSEFSIDVAYATFLQNAEDFSTKGLHLVGATNFDSLKIQERSSKALSFYVCDDVSGTDLIDSSGLSIVQSDRKSRSSWLVSAESTMTDGLKISSKVLWEGANVC